jgi:small subunit ribosomal protein S4
MHGREARFRRRRESDYSRQLREKQKARRIYGILERQFRRYFSMAQRRSGLTGVNLLVILESRLDNVVYRLGFAESRPQARQLVSHGHFYLNGRKTDVPSAIVKSGDVISVRPESRRRTFFKTLSQEMDDRQVPRWLQLDTEALSGQVAQLPTRDDIDVSLNEQLIVEFYSR